MNNVSSLAPVLAALMLVSITTVAAAVTELMNVDSEAVKRVLTNDRERVWKVEAWRTVNSGSVCHGEDTYTFSVGGKVNIRRCADGGWKEVVERWKVKNAANEQLVLEIGEKIYDLRVRVSGNIHQIKLRTLYEVRSTIAVETVLFSPIAE